MAGEFPVKKREEMLAARIEQMRRNDEWHLFQDFCLGLLPHEGYKDNRPSAPRRDYGKDGITCPPDGRPCFAAVSFTSKKDKVRQDAERRKKDPNREPAEVMVFMTWGSPSGMELSKWRGDIKGDFGLELRVFGKEAILATATREGVWKETCERLGITLSEGIDPERAAELRGRYLDWLVRNYGSIDFAGYLPGVVPYGKPLFLPLEDIFVSLKLRETFQRSVPKAELERGKELRARGPQAARRRDEFDLDLEEAYERERRREQVRILDVGEALAKNPKAVILGDPGAGKTTLLKYIALACARGPEAVKDGLALPETRTPILVSVAALFQKHDKERIGLLSFIRDEIKNAGLEPETADVVTADIQSGRAAILLDGLDEVLTTEMRLQVVRQIESLVAGHPTNRYVISSRIVGYTTAPIGPDFTELTVEPFDDPAIKGFSRKWCVALEKYIAGDGDDAVRRGEEEAKNLHEAIIHNPGVKSLARNPLMLTILSLIHRQGKKMPSRRIELYALCTRALIESWCLVRDISRIPAGEALDERDILDVLCPVAFRMHCDYPSGVIPGKELRKLMARAIVDVRGKEQRIAEREAESLLDIMQKHSGLISERGQDAYGFLHLTFEEYLTARHIAMDRDKMWTRLRPVLHHPRWREIVLLTAGCLGILLEDRQSCERLINGIRDADSPLEKTIHRDLLLALECACDDLKISPAAHLELVEQALDLWRTTASRQFDDRLLALLARLPHGPARVRVQQRFLNALDDSDSDVRDAAARALGTLAQASPEVVKALLNALKDKNSHVRSAAAYALGNLGQASPEVVKALLNALKDKEAHVRSAAAEGLRKLGQASPEVVDALVNALKDPQILPRYAVAGALGTLGRAAPQVAKSLLHALKDSDVCARSAAAHALGTLGRATRQVLKALLDALRDSDRYVRSGSAAALGKLGPQTSLELAKALLKALNDRTWRVRFAAASALGTLGQASPEVVKALLNAMKDSDWSVRSAAARALGNLGPQASPEVVKALVNALKDSQWNVRSAAAGALGKLGPQTSPEAVEPLLRALKESKTDVRSAAARALGKVGQASPEVVNALLNAMKDKDRDVRSAAAYALGNLAQTSPEVVKALLNALEDSQWNVRSAAAGALGRLGPQTSPQVVNALLNALKDSQWQVREKAANALGSLGIIDVGVISALSAAFNQDDDYGVANAAYGALLRIAAKLDREAAPCE